MRCPSSSRKLQGRLEKHTKMSGSRLIIHIASEEEIWCLEGEAFCCVVRVVGSGGRIGYELVLRFAR